jgi:hypothetical protein
VTTRDEQIRLIAYQIWEEEGRPHGKHVEHWIQAERRWSQMNRSGNGGGAAVAARPAAPAIRQPTSPTPEPARAARPAPRAAANPPESDKKGDQTRPPRTRRPEK